MGQTQLNAHRSNHKKSMVRATTLTSMRWLLSCNFNPFVVIQKLNVKWPRATWKVTGVFYPIWSKGPKSLFVNFDWRFGNYCSIKQLSKSTFAVDSFVLSVLFYFSLKVVLLCDPIKWLLTRIVFIDKEAIFRVLLTQIVVRKDKIFWSKTLTWSSSNFKSK